MRGLLFLADREEVLREVHSVVRGRRTVVASDAVTNLVGAVGGLRQGAVVAAGTGAVAFGSDFGEHWNRVDGWGHVLVTGAPRPARASRVSAQRSAGGTVSPAARQRCWPTERTASARSTAGHGW